MKTNFFKNCFLFFSILLCLISCSDKYAEGYNKGYKEGYEKGYDIGHAKGHEEGHLDGYLDGHLDGAVAFLKDSWIPSLGLVASIFGVAIILYLLYKNFKNPIKRLIDKFTNQIEAIRQKNILREELLRTQQSEEEIARVKAIIVSTKILEDSKKLLIETFSLKEFEKIRLETEERIFNIQMKGIDKIIEQYELAARSVQITKYTNGKEEAEMYKFLRNLLNDKKLAAEQIGNKL
jgi:hypothetical protein